MSAIRKLRKGLVAHRVSTALMLKKIVDANQGDYNYVRDNFKEALMETFKPQTSVEVFGPKEGGAK